MPEFEVYIKEGCHLCEAMLEELEAFRKECDKTGSGFVYRVIDIQDNETDFNRYREIIPALIYQENELCRYFFDQDAVKQVLHMGYQP